VSEYKVDLQYLILEWTAIEAEEREKGRSDYLKLVNATINRLLESATYEELQKFGKITQA
jgi:hypothetical protein